MRYERHEGCETETVSLTVTSILRTPGAALIQAAPDQTIFELRCERDVLIQSRFLRLMPAQILNVILTAIDR